MPDITQLLHEIEDGDPQAASELLPLVYDELRKLAAAKMAAERDDHTLQATALVHEAFLRLVRSSYADEWNSRGHFFAAAAEAMRRILVDHARNTNRLKRGSDAQRVSLDAVEQFWKPQYCNILDLHDALDRLEQESPHAAELVKLRCFAGQSQKDAAVLLGISERTAKRWWTFARAWLYNSLKSSESSTY